jgi:UPF0755 protein
MMSADETRPNETGSTSTPATPEGSAPPPRDPTVAQPSDSTVAPPPRDSTVAPPVAPPIARPVEPTRITPRSPRARLEPERVPQPAKASRRARHPIVIAGNAIFTIIILIAIVGGIGLAVGKQRFEAAGPLEQEKIVNIPRGSGLTDIGDLLQREGVIDQKWVFVGGVLLMKAKDDLKSGEYLFPRKATLRDVVDTIVEGKVVQHQLTIPEGLTSEQVVARLLENDILTGSLREIPREGTLLPETYKFARGTTRERAIQMMQQAHQKVVKEVWERRSADLPIKTPEQLVTMASIIEKETSRGDERTRVAAVFMNRLKVRMKLQSDPTIIYGLVGGKGTLGRPIMKSEIEQATPYNTYVIEGIPPGPIANPGRAAIEAAANPSRTKELFFVADGTGGHAFAETGDQHNRNVGRLRAIEAQAREAAKATQDPAQPSSDASTAPPAPAAAAPPPANAQPAPQAATPAPATPRPRAQQGRNPTGSRQQ